MKRILILAVLLTVVGCKSHRQITTSNTVKDSTFVQVNTIVREVLKTDTVYINFPEESKMVLKADSSFLSTSLAESWAIIQPDGLLSHTLTNKAYSAPVQYTYKNTETVRDSIVYRDKLVDNMVEVHIRYIGKFHKFCVWWFAITGALIALYLLSKFRK